MNELISNGLQSVPTDGDILVGYWILCDTKQVSPEAARLTDDFPLGLENREITMEDLSPYSKEV